MDMVRHYKSDGAFFCTFEQDLDGLHISLRLKKLTSPCCGPAAMLFLKYNAAITLPHSHFQIIMGWFIYSCWGLLQM
jgi:hypothetical protein